MAHQISKFQRLESKKFSIFVANLITPLAMKYSYLRLLVFFLVFLSGCSGVVKITGQSDELREGGVVLVCYPNDTMTSVADASIEPWAYPLLARRVVPNDSGYFSTEIPVKRVGEIIFVAGRWRRSLDVERGDSLHFEWQRGDSSIRISGRQRAFADVEGYYDMSRERQLRQHIRDAYSDAISFSCGMYSENIGKLRDTLFVDSILLFYKEHMEKQQELMRLFGASKNAVAREVRKMYRWRVHTVNGNCPTVGAEVAQFYRKEFIPKRDKGLSRYYYAKAARGNYLLNKRYDKAGVPFLERAKYELPLDFRVVQEGCLAAAALVRNGDGELLYDSLRFVNRLVKNEKLAGRDHPLVELHRMVYDARMAWIREPYAPQAYYKDARPLDSLFRGCHADTAARGYAVWLWLEDDGDFIRSAKALATAERALRRAGVRSIYVPFYERESSVAFAMYRLGLKEPFAAVTREGRSALLRLLGGRPLRRSRCLLFDAEGNFVTADLPGSLGAEGLEESVRKALVGI